MMDAFVIFHLVPPTIGKNALSPAMQFSSHYLKQYILRKRIYYKMIPNMDMYRVEKMSSIIE